MKNEMQSLNSFDTYEEVPVSSVDDSIFSTVMTLLWVHVWKGFVKSRLCVRGYNQKVNDLDETYASTPVIYVLRILLVMALSRGWLISFYDISTAFLHAALNSDDPVYSWPPSMVRAPTVDGNLRLGTHSGCFHPILIMLLPRETRWRWSSSSLIEELTPIRQTNMD